MTTNYPDPDRIKSGIAIADQVAILVNAASGVTVFVARNGEVEEHDLAGHPAFGYETDDVSREIRDYEAQGFVEWEA